MFSITELEQILDFLSYLQNQGKHPQLSEFGQQELSDLLVVISNKLMEAQS